MTLPTSTFMITKFLLILIEKQRSIALRLVVARTNTVDRKKLVF